MDTRTWHGFEIALESAFYLAAYTTAEAADAAFDEARATFGDTIETYIIGTVAGETLEDALDAIRMGDWLSYTQST